jgi:predicted amidohydrolase
MGDEYRDFTLAAVQAAPVYLDRDASVEKACGLIEQAAAQGAELAVFGETWLCGYPSFASSSAHPAFLGALQRLIRNGVEIPSPATDALCAAARRAGIDVVIGVAERDAVTHGSIYCTILFIGREGRILGTHRKLKPTFFERSVWGEGDGSTLRLYDRPYGKLGGLNCWEHQMMLPGYALLAQGLQVHAALWPGWSETRQEILSRAFAMQACAFVVMTGSVLREQDIPAELRDLVRPMNGHSAILGPGGDILAGPLLDEEGILTAKGNLGQVAFLRMISDHAGHYTRPDVFELRVDARPRRAAVFRGRDDRVWPAELRDAIAAGLTSGAIRSEDELRDAIAQVDPELARTAARTATD